MGPHRDQINIARQRMLFAARHNMQESMSLLADPNHTPQYIPTGQLRQPGQWAITARDCRRRNNKEIHQ